MKWNKYLIINKIKTKSVAISLEWMPLRYLQGDFCFLERSSTDPVDLNLDLDLDLFIYIAHFSEKVLK